MSTDPEELLRTALHDHAQQVRPAPDLSGLDARLVRADQLTRLQALGAGGVALVLLIVGLVVLGTHRGADDEVRTAASTQVSITAAPPTTPLPAGAGGTGTSTTVAGTDGTTPPDAAPPGTDAAGNPTISTVLDPTAPTVPGPPVTDPDAPPTTGGGPSTTAGPTTTNTTTGPTITTTTIATTTTAPAPCTANPATFDSATQRFTVNYTGRSAAAPGSIIVISSPVITNGVRVGSTFQVRATSNAAGAWSAKVDFSVPNSQIGQFLTVDVSCERAGTTKVLIRRTA